MMGVETTPLRGK